MVVSDKTLITRRSEGLFFDILWVLAMLVPVVCAMEWFVIHREEKYLEVKFDEAYREYKQKAGGEDRE